MRTGAATVCRNFRRLGLMGVLSRVRVQESRVESRKSPKSGVWRCRSRCRRADYRDDFSFVPSVDFEVFSIHGQ